MTTLWGRRAALTVGTVKVESEGERGLRLVFRASKTLRSKDPNTLELSVYNLSADTRGRLDDSKAPKLPITIEAGYADAMGSVFTGQTLSIASTKEPTGWVTKIRAADGHETKSVHINKSLGPRATQADAFDHLLDQLSAKAGLAVEQAKARVKKGDAKGAIKEFFRGIQLSGSAQDLAERFARDMGLDFGVDGGEVFLLGEDETLPSEAVLLEPGTGLIGSPEIARDEVLTTTGELKAQATGKTVDGAVSATIVRATSLLNCRITPGVRVVIKSAVVEGFLRVLKTETAGDTHGAEWTTALEGRAL